MGLIESRVDSRMDAHITAVQRRIDLEAAFSGISKEQREVLVLHYVLDLPLREVAAVLELPEGTAKSRLHAGLRALRSRMPSDG